MRGYDRTTGKPFSDGTIIRQVLTLLGMFTAACADSMEALSGQYYISAALVSMPLWCPAQGRMCK